MKILIVIVLFLFGFGFISSAQKVNPKDVPAPVKTSFTKLYPKITDVKWEKEKEIYEVGFTFNNVKTSVSFDEKGTLIETETVINISQLPKPAIDYVKKNYPGEKIKEADKIVDAKGIITYEIGIKKTDLVFDVKGNFIKKEKD